MDIKRREFLKIICTAGVAVSGIDSFFIEPSNVEENYLRIETDKLKKKIRIVHVSDLHLDNDVRRDYVFQMINNRSPDLILMTGDYVNSPDYIGKASEFSERLRSRYGVFACFGNWDEGIETQMFKDTDVKTLRDKSVDVETESGIINITGLEFMWNSYPEKQLEEIILKKDKRDYNIILYHSPDLIEEVAKNKKTDLYLCGHTHGGQIRLPFMKMFKDESTRGEFPYTGAVVTPPSSRFGRKYDAGRYDIENMVVYVSKGIGNTAGVPVRFMCNPEITTIDIVPTGFVDQKEISPSNL